jgi:hypothetical protein
MGNGITFFLGEAGANWLQSIQCALCTDIKLDTFYPTVYTMWILSIRFFVDRGEKWVCAHDIFLE